MNLNRRTEDYIQGFADLVIKNKGDKYEVVTVDAMSPGSSKNYSVMDLSQDALYDN